MSSVGLGFGIAFAVVVISLYLGVYTYIRVSYRLCYPNLIDEHNIELTIRIQPPPAVLIAGIEETVRNSTCSTQNTRRATGHSDECKRMRHHHCGL